MKATTILKIFSTILTPLAIALFGYWFSEAIKEREIRQKYVEIAIGILSEESSHVDQSLRAWAVEVINNYSDIKLTIALVQNLSKGISVLPSPGQSTILSNENKIINKDILFEELSLKKLDTHLCDALNHLKGKSQDASIKACEIYRDVISKLSISSRNRLNQTLLKNAETDFENTEYQNAAIEYKVLFNDLYNFCN